MEGIYKIDGGDNPFIQKMDFPKIGYYELPQDADFHNFVINIFEHNPIKKLIIPVHLGNAGIRFRGLKLALHIRLTAEIGEGRFIPIVLVADDDFENIMFLAKNSNLNLNYLLLTEGCFLAEENEILIQKLIQTKEPIDPLKFKSEVLDRLKVLPSEEVGKHSLANQWGAFRLDEMARTQALEDKKDLKNKQKELYFKYIRSFNDDYSDLNKVESTSNTAPKIVNSVNKKILLIDDEADKGWADVLDKIFIGADFQVISKNSFPQLKAEAEHKIQQEDWDLILLDLRLNPTKEEKSEFIAEGKIENYSGTELLKLIKTKNRGTQVIIFTASNKAWNMKALLNLGADGYFIKESPELGFSNDFSRENIDNFLSTAKNCLDKYYLQDIFRQKASIETQLQTKKGFSTDYDDFLDELQTQIEISYNLLYPAITVPEFAYAFFSLYKVLEAIGKQKVENSLITASKNHVWNVTTRNLEQNQNTGSKGVFQKIAYIHKHMQGQNDNTFFEKLYWVKEWRNDVGHSLTNTDSAEIEKFRNGYLDLLEIIVSFLPVI